MTLYQCSSCNTQSADATVESTSVSKKESLRIRIIDVCDKKVAAKGPNVGLSFYAFFANKNDDPELLMEVAEWWIMTHKLDHFEKALKIKEMVELKSGTS